jgi:MoCo/4Fe-4S cofactor protein with predicted Tat translocation signal
MDTMEQTPKPKMDWEAVEARLANAKGKQYWRGLEEIAETPEFQSWLDDEFPNRSTLMAIDRRTLLKYMGASMALAGLSGCRGLFLPQAKVVPYVRAPEELVYGKPLFYASIYTQSGYAKGVLVEQHEGRPTKIEGNPDHPASLGAADSFVQASILSLYDPDRAQNVTQGGDISTWETFYSTARTVLTDGMTAGGGSIRILTENITSPSLSAEIQKFLKAFPGSVWHQWEPTSQDNLTVGAQQAFGKPVHTYYDFTKAKAVVSFDGEFLASMPGSMAYAKQFADGRRDMKKGMNRLYSFESMPTITGAYADHRWAVRASEVEFVARAIAVAVGVAGAGAGTLPAGVTQDHINAVAGDLKANRGGSVVLAGQHQPPVVHQLCHSINAALGNNGKTVMNTEPLEAQPVVHLDSLKTLVTDMNAGKVKALFIFGANPVYTAPMDFKFADALAKVSFRVQHSYYDDETGGACEWHLPEAHYLEAWGDAKAYDGTVSIQQPLIQPLFEGKSACEVISALRSEPGECYDLVKAHYATGDAKAFEKEWRRWLNSGVANVPKAAVVSVSPSGSIPAPTPVKSGAEIIFQLDPTVYDGRFANNGWLQELPKPITKITWDNVVHMSPGTAKQLGGLSDEDAVVLTYNGQTVKAAAWVLPGHPDNSFTVHLGYGRTRGGTVCQGLADENLGGEVKREPWGFNAYAMRGSKAMDIDFGATVKGVGGYVSIATTQIHHTMKGYDIVRSGTADDFAKDPSLKPADAESREEIEKQNLYPDQVFSYNGPQWGMTVDLNTCIGCNACVTACQAENNIPVVGKLQVKKSRELHWIRIDRYYVTDENADENNLKNPHTVFQPMMCVNCEKAPCEPVCPVAATIHSHEGLNQMVYNRCVGTRYCSNNCPYKVRRFNYLNFSDNQEQFNTQVPPAAREPKPHGIELLRMLNNPDVTVRGRGIMEKCTYCVQRINEARIEAKKIGRDPMDGEIITACQQACPTKTIVFGNIADDKSAVSILRNDPRAYRVLEELQTRPRTSYLGKVRNPNPDIKEFNA